MYFLLPLPGIHLLLTLALAVFIDTEGLLPFAGKLEVRLDVCLTTANFLSTWMHRSGVLDSATEVYRVNSQTRQGF